MPKDLDAIDARILELIQEDAGLSVADVADAVGLSSSPCWRRIKRLEEQGVIEKRVTLINREAVGLDFEVYADVKLEAPTKDNLDRFETEMNALPEVVDCAAVTGALDYVLRIVTADMHAYDTFLRDRILSIGLVRDVQSRIVVRRVKATTSLPLKLLDVPAR